MVRCRYVNNEIMIYININKKIMPCCFIKNDSQYKSIGETKEIMKNNSIPVYCVGCNNLSVKP